MPLRHTLSIFLALHLMALTALGQSPTCTQVAESAAQVSINSCGCRTAPKCTACRDLGRATVQSATCINGCEYCRKSNNSNSCGTMQKRDVWGSAFNALTGTTETSFKIEYVWNFTRGRDSGGSVEYVYSTGAELTNDSWCTIRVNGKKCASCQLTQCRTSTGTTRRLEPTVDCTNLQAGATATACNGQSAGGPISLDESATLGILAPLAYPYQLCLRSSVILGNATVIAPPTSSPAAAPTTVGAVPDSEKCGLFKLGVLCLNGCGWIRRILGLCKNAN